MTAVHVHEGEWCRACLTHGADTMLAGMAEAERQHDYVRAALAQPAPAAPQLADERVALDAGTHKPAVDDFGNQYLEPAAPSAAPAPGNAYRATHLRGDPLFDLDDIEMRWASQWNESDDGEVRAWRSDVAALIDEVHRLRRVANGYFEEMVRRTPNSAALRDTGADEGSGR